MRVLPLTRSFHSSLSGKSGVRATVVVHPFNTGGPIKYLVGPTVHTKTIYFAIFTNNIWFYLLWPPVIVYHEGYLHVYELL